MALVNSVVLSANAALITVLSLIVSSTVDVAEAGSNLCVGGSHTCFIDKSKSLYCWGSNTYGQTGALDLNTYIGDNSGEMGSLLAISSSANEVTCGASHTCFTTSSGVYCFGSNTFGELGHGTASSYETYNSISSKVSLPTQSTYHVSTFYKLTCASTVDSIYCWGYSSYSSYGSSPVKVAGPLASTVSQITVGYSHACYLLANGDAYCWGDNFYGQLGISSTSSSVSTPTKVDISLSLSSISAGYDHTCVVYSSSGKAACFGYNSYYQLGDMSSISKGTSSSDMISLSTDTRLGTGMVYAGNYVTCLVRSSDSGIYCIGYNSANTICSKSSTTASYGFSSSDYPPNNQLMIPLYNTITIALGYGTHQCATDGSKVYCWGMNTYGQLGTESYYAQTSCTSVSSLKKVCLDGSCSSDTPCYSCGISILPFIPIIIVSSILILTWSILIFMGCRKRQEFDARVYLLPNGGQISGAQIWKSYTRPLGPIGLQNQTIPQMPTYAIAAVPVAAVPVATGYPGSENEKGSYVPNV